MTCCGGNGVALEVAGSTSSDGRARLAEESLRLAAHQNDDGLLQSDFIVPDMHCAACLSKIERSLNDLPFVERARANLSTRRVSVFWHPDRGAGSEISETLDHLGYSNTPFDLAELAADDGARTTRQLLLALAVAGFAAANIMLLSVSVWSGADAETAQMFHLISGLIAIPAVAFSGQPFFRSALGALQGRRLNMDVPISLAVLLALLMSSYESLTGGESAYFDASVTLLFFLLIGRTLDHVMRERARGAVTRLASFAAKGAGVVGADGNVDFVPLSEIEPGTRILVNAGERFPVDGKVVSGQSDIDRSLVTGESASVTIGPDDTFEAGTLNLTGPVEAIALKRAEDSFLSEIIEMMEAAGRGKAKYIRIADRMASIYAPAVHILAALTFVCWMIWTRDWHSSGYAAIAVLIITCPCALGLAVPVVHVVGANRLFRDGVMIKDGAAFEKLGEVTKAVFDKTGTLTIGKPRVVSVLGDADRHQDIIRTLAARSHHPAARAVLESLAKGPAADLENLLEIPGYGVEASLNGKRIRLGKPGWVAEVAAGKSQDHRGSSVTAFAIEEIPVTLFELEDVLRPDAVEAVSALSNWGLDPEILSGDAPAEVASVAAKLGIAKYAGALTPDEKIARLSKMQNTGDNILMVGDGINDAPALAMGHVSMAPASGSDVGRLAADLVFTRDSLSAVTLARNVACKANRLVKQNFGIAIAYNCIAVPLAMAGYVTPLIAAIAMSASSIVVVANSMRLGMTGASRDREPDHTVENNRSAKKSAPIRKTLEAAA